MDRNHYFANPVSPDQAPDYHNIIDQPMYWDKIQQKLDQREYLNLQDFKVSHLVTNVDVFLHISTHRMTFAWFWTIA